MSERYAAIFMDLDGVIVDSGGDLSEATLVPGRINHPLVKRISHLPIASDPASEHYYYIFVRRPDAPIFKFLQENRLCFRQFRYCDRDGPARVVASKLSQVLEVLSDSRFRAVLVVDADPAVVATCHALGIPALLPGQVRPEKPRPECETCACWACPQTACTGALHYAPANYPDCGKCPHVNAFVCADAPDDEPEQTRCDWCGADADPESPRVRGMLLCDECAEDADTENRESLDYLPPNPYDTNPEDP